MDARVAHRELSSHPMRLPLLPARPVAPGRPVHGLDSLVAPAPLPPEFGEAHPPCPHSTPAPNGPIRRLRLRCNLCERNGAGRLGASIDPSGPIPHVPGDGTPWLDTWFHTNPIFLETKG